MKCPSCSANLPDDAADCPGCGINFEKWSNRAAAQGQPGPASETAAAAEEGTYFPVFWVVAACLLIGGFYFGNKAYHKYLPGGLTDLAKPKFINKDQPQAAAAAQPAQPPAKPGPELLLNGFDSVFRDYSARAASFGLQVIEGDARKFFQYGVDDAYGMDFDMMEAAGLTFGDTPFTEEEKNKAKTEAMGAKCSGPNGIAYLGGLPG